MRGESLGDLRAKSGKSGGLKRHRAAQALNRLAEGVVFCVVFCADRDIPGTMVCHVITSPPGPWFAPPTGSACLPCR